MSSRGCCGWLLYPQTRGTAEAAVVACCGCLVTRDRSRTLAGKARHGTEREKSGARYERGACGSFSGRGDILTR